MKGFICTYCKKPIQVKEIHDYGHIYIWNRKEGKRDYYHRNCFLKVYYHE